MRAVVLSLSICLSAAATPLSISHNNSTITVDPSSVLGLASWTIQGEEQSFEQEFWYRGPGDSFENPVSSLPLLAASAVGNQIDVSYANSILGVSISYALQGALSGHASRVREFITLSNLSGAPLPLAWFMEADLDVGGTSSGDVVTGGLAGFTQSDGARIVKISSTFTPSAYEAGAFPGLFLALGDLAPTNLSDTGTPFGPGDASVAWQWNLVLDTGASLSYEVDKFSTPEPNTGVLIVLAAAAGLTRVRWRKSR